MIRLRAGIALIIVSWLPAAILIVNLLHVSGHQADKIRLSIWALQIVIGLIGVWLAGKVAIAEVKREGIKNAPKRLWKLFLHGRSPAEDKN